MTEDQVPEFVDAILATGCPICAVGHDTYVFAELDVPEDDFERVVKDVAAICGKYGQRDHLRLDITAYLRSIGRYIDCDRASAIEEHPNNNGVASLSNQIFSFMIAVWVTNSIS